MRSELGGLLVAVRSSASVEDGAAASFAGQFDTALGVQGAPEVLQRIRQTWASLWNARALRTMAAAGVSPLETIQAVLVQNPAQVDSDDEASESDSEYVHVWTSSNQVAGTSRRL